MNPSPGVARSDDCRLIIIAVGAVLLLNQLGIFPHGIVVHFWPVALIVVGLIKIFNGKGGASGWRVDV